MVQVRTLERVLKQAGIPKRKVELVIAEVSKPRRQPAPEPPEGAISLSAGSRKFSVPYSTIAGWVNSGYIPVLLNTGYKVYVEEARLEEVAAVHNKKPGRGRRTVQKKFKPFNAA